MKVSAEMRGLGEYLAVMANANKQVRFAASQAVNQTARDVQTDVVENLLPSKFTLRSRGAPWQRPGTKLGFNVRPWANKETLTAILGSQADWLKLQEQGGEKKISGHRVAIPTTFWKSRQEIMERSKKPRALLNKINSGIARQKQKASILESNIQTLSGKRDKDNNKLRRSLKSELRMTKGKLKAAAKISAAVGSLDNAPFKARMKSGKEGIFVRTTSKRGPIKMLFSFEESTRVKAALEFEARSRDVVRKVYARHFGRAIANALATAK